MEVFIILIWYIFLKIYRSITDMKKLKFIIFILIFFTFSDEILLPKELSVNILNKKFKGGNLYTEVSLKGNLSFDTIDAIRNGITAKLFVTLQLLRNGGFMNLGHVTISEKTVSMTISYNVWDNNFALKGKDFKKDIRISNPGAITGVIEKNINPIILIVKSSKIKSKLVIRGKIEIQTIKLYPPFGIFLYFFDPWNYESEWIYSNVFMLVR